MRAVKIWLVVAMSLVMLGSVAVADMQVINPKAAFPEGPVWQGDKLFYVEYGAHTVMTWDGAKNDQFWSQAGCGPSAVVPTADGDFLVTCYDNGTVVRISAEGKTSATYAKDKHGHTFLGPNDFAADAKGGVYFSASGPWESAPIVGKIFYMAADGTITQMADDLHYANGLALSADGKTLYCAESEAHRVIQFAVAPDASLSDRRQFVVLGQIDAKSGAGAYPDGLKLDRKGNLYIGQFSAGRILVVNAKGELVRTIDVPSPAAPNLNFNPDESMAYVMAVDDVNNAPYLGKVYAVPLQ